MDEKQWLSDSNHTLNKQALEKAARALIESKDDDPDRPMYGRRLYSDGTRSLTCPMVPYWELVASDLILAVSIYLGSNDANP